jgi:hypothetical protein
MIGNSDGSEEELRESSCAPGVERLVVVAEKKKNRKLK